MILQSSHQRPRQVRGFLLAQGWGAETATDAMTYVDAPFDDNAERRLATSGNTGIDLPFACVDLLHAIAVECSAKRNHGQASLE